MSQPVILSLIVQALAVALVVARVRGRLLTHCGAVFILVCAAFHGLTELAQWLFPGRNERYRSLITARDLDTWITHAGIAVCLMTVVYTVTLRAPRQAPPTPEPLVKYLPPWGIWAALALLLVVIAVRSQALATDGALSVSAGLAGQFVEWCIIFAGVAYVARKPHALGPVVVVQALVLFAMGSRLTALIALVVMLGCVRLVNRETLSRRFTAWAGLVGAVLMILLAHARDVAGRADFAALSLVGRIRLMVLSAPTVNVDGILDQLVYRFDGNTYPALIAGGYAAGGTSAGLAPFTNMIKMTIPAVLYPDKLDWSVLERSDKELVAYHFGFWGTGLDFLPTTLGMFYAMAGVIGLYSFAVALALGLALFDRWTHRRATPWTLPLFAAVMTAAMNVGQGTKNWVFTARGMLVIVVVLLVWSLIAYNLRLRRGYHSSVPGGQRYVRS